MNRRSLFFKAPSKKLSEEEIVENLLENYNSADKDVLCTKLKKNGVDVLDIRTFMPQDYTEYMSMFYQTDHHWKTTTGFWAASLIGKKLNDEYEFMIDERIYDLEEYAVRVYPNLFLGSQGKKVTLSYCNTEDFELVIPRFSNDLHIQIPQKEIDIDGDFMDLINESQLKLGKPYELDPYGSYGYGEQPLIKIENKNVNNQKSILFLKDSFANTVYPYIALGCESVDVIDLRLFKGSLKSYLNQNSYDMVIFLTNTAGNDIGAEVDSKTSLWCFE